MLTKRHSEHVAVALIALGAFGPSQAVQATELATVEVVKEDETFLHNTYELPQTENAASGGTSVAVAAASVSADTYSLRNDPFAEQARINRRRFIRREIVFQTLNVIDAVQTMSCMQSIDCREMNPLLGERPSSNEILAFKAGTGAAHLLVSYLLYEHAPEALSGWQLSTVVVQGGAVGWNLQYSF